VCVCVCVYTPDSRETLLLPRFARARSRRAPWQCDPPRASALCFSVCACPSNCTPGHARRQYVYVCVCVCVCFCVCVCDCACPSNCTPGHAKTVCVCVCVCVLCVSVHVPATAHQERLHTRTCKDREGLEFRVEGLGCGIARAHDNMHRQNPLAHCSNASAPQERGRRRVGGALKAVRT